MKIQEQDLYHGAALTQIVESGQFTALNRDGQKYGLYVVNHNRRLLIKHRTAAGKQGRYRFTFSVAELDTLQQHAATNGTRIFVALVCGQRVICCLSVVELATMIDLDSEKQQWVLVEAPEGKKMRTRGSLGDGPLVAAKDFPAKVLA
jgi:hypothetical protein